MSAARRYAGVVRDVELLNNQPVRLVGIDGLGGAGKTTFAARLSAHANSCPVIHTDDFAEHDVLMQRWPRILHEVIDPLSAGKPATFRRYDWVARGLTEPITVEPAPVVVIEGVGATRKAWRDMLALRVWIETPRDERLRRGLERDGAHMADFWESWMAAEDAYFDEEHPEQVADIVVDGTASETNDDAFVVLIERQRGEPQQS